jgi:2-polyprenyl-6-hydroxyphenyl methylase/3-demethylubiquinone-9 3-methyltransferase
MTDTSYYKFYRNVGLYYPEEEIVYGTLRGKLRRKFILERIGRWNGTLLDIGCNRGMYMAQYTGGRATGVDLSLHLLKHALNRGKSNPGPLQCILGDAEKLSFIKSTSFDHVLCSELLEHVYHPEEVIAGIARILKPGGTALLTTPNYTKKKPAWIPVGLLKQYGIDGITESGYYHTAFKPPELAALAEKEGLRVVEQGSLEREVRYATKIPVVFYFVVDFINRTVFKNSKIDHWNSMLLDLFSQKIYALACIMKTDRILQSFFPEGARSYVLVTTRS